MHGIYLTLQRLLAYICIDPAVQYILVYETKPINVLCDTVTGLHCSCHHPIENSDMNFTIHHLGYFPAQLIGSLFNLTVHLAQGINVLYTAIVLHIGDITDTDISDSQYRPIPIRNSYMRNEGSVVH